MYEFAKGMNFDTKAPGRKSTRDRTLIYLVKSPTNMASEISTIFLLSNPDKLCNRLKLLLQEKHGGNNSHIINDEIVAIIIKLIEHKYIAEKQRKQILIRRILLHK